METTFLFSLNVLRREYGCTNGVLFGLAGMLLLASAARDKLHIMSNMVYFGIDLFHRLHAIFLENYHLCSKISVFFLVSLTLFFLGFKVSTLFLYLTEDVSEESPKENIWTYSQGQK
jgi:hypothetical protein